MITQACLMADKNCAPDGRKESSQRKCTEVSDMVTFFIKRAADKNPDFADL
jgi:hypothetical protein